MKFRQSVFLLICLSGIFRITGAQEVRGLTENPVIKQYLRQKPAGKKVLKSATMLSLPFFEDFSTSDVVPDPSKWANAYAFINNSFALDPISVGVATLDAIDANGDVYATNNLPKSSDTLTTLPFDLAPLKGSINKAVLSFFYQAGGKGETPEKTDSLNLEFYSPATGKWRNIWHAMEDTITPFRQVIIPVPDTFYQTGFRFRFRNVTSMSPGEVSGGYGALSNCDVWNIDYIMMNTQPVSDHQQIEDISLVDIPRQLLDFYESVPWTHLYYAQNITQNKMIYRLRYITGGDSSATVYRGYNVTNLNTGLTNDYKVGGSVLGPDTLETWSDDFFGVFSRPPGDQSSQCSMKVVGYITTYPGQVKQNDTVSTTIHFKNYYAYDDGTPEYGFGISGESSSGALLAMRFRTYRTDTLTSLQMLFNKTRNHENANKEFHLCVWKDDNGVPGENIYLSEGTYVPGADTNFNRFNTYPLDSGIVISDTSFFAGWKQVTEDYLNLGYDVNRNTLSRVYVNIGGSWVNPGSSLLPGTPMIRAVFGHGSLVSGNHDHSMSDGGIGFYPNPAQSQVYIEAGQNTISSLTLMDLQGRVVLHAKSDVQQIDVSGYTPGIYLLQVTTGQGKVLNYKLVINR